MADVAPTDAERVDTFAERLARLCRAHDVRLRGLGLADPVIVVEASDDGRPLGRIPTPIPGDG